MISKIGRTTSRKFDKIIFQGFFWESKALFYFSVIGVFILLRKCYKSDSLLAGKTLHLILYIEFVGDALSLILVHIVFLFIICAAITNLNPKLKIRNR